MTGDRRISDIGERGWIDLLRDRLGGSRSGLLVPIGDDAAVREKRVEIDSNLEPLPESCEILTTDVMVEGTHFKKEWLDWSGLARRAVLSAASDIAAMGGAPEGFLLSLGLPPDALWADLESFADSLRVLCDETGMVPFGGDTARSQTLFLDVTVIGRVEKDLIHLQTGGQVGDALWVTGSLGAMRAAWSALDAPRPGEEDLRRRFWDPPIRWPLLNEIRKAIPIRAMTDLSDGLAVDLKKILRGTGCGAEIQMEQLPVDPLAEGFCGERGIDPIEFAFLGGEDFELLVVEKGNRQTADSINLGEVPLRRIGLLTDRDSEVARLRDGRRDDSLVHPFEHFGGM